MYDPESPGSIIPLIPIIPQINTNNRLEFSVAGVAKLNEKATIVPNINASIDCIFQFSTLLPTKIIDARISPKKKAHISIGYSENRYSNKLAIVKTLTILPKKTDAKK
jgi:hypothetical protein|tara:strand:- start:66 stop:389 length:324 start_codon:yes stop_codon:yes gene_type:complete